MDQIPNHEFKIHFRFQGKVYSALLTMIQKNDHDEYHVVPDDEILKKVYGSQTIDNYYNQEMPLRGKNNKSEYINAILNGVQEFLDSKHS
jgi:hypothetical protein